jgi:hypothetical protein
MPPVTRWGLGIDNSCARCLSKRIPGEHSAGLASAPGFEGLWRKPHVLTWIKAGRRKQTGGAVGTLTGSRP